MKKFKKKLTTVKKIKILTKIYYKLQKKLTNFSKLNKSDRIAFFFKKVNKHCPRLLIKVSKKKLFSKIFVRKVNLKRPLKQVYKYNHKFLTKKLKKLMKRFPIVDPRRTAVSSLKRKLFRMNKIVLSKRLRKNFSRKTFFYKIIQKKKKRRLKVFRINKLKPIFTKQIKKESKFLLRARESLIKTKKFLYRKQFPKIKGKKNKNFNFYYYNNMDKLPFKFYLGRVVITYLLNNTFINIHNSKKMLKVLSAGKLGFKGPKRSTPYSRQVVARKAIKYIAKSNLNVLDIFLNSNYNRWYYFIFKEMSKPKVKPYVIRYLVVSNSRSHGFIRDRKHRRK